MAVNAKAIKGRIKSVGNIKKITKAMELVAAAKMRRAVDAALATRTYALLAWELLINLSKTAQKKVSLLEERPIKKVLALIVTSNRGLCGSYNANVLKKAAKELLEENDLTIELIAIGKRSINFAKKNNLKVIAAYDSISDVPSLDEIMPISQMIIKEYSDGNYDKVLVIYTDFESSLSQVAVSKQILPVSQGTLEEMISTIGDKDDSNIKTETKDLIAAEYIFEPSEKVVLERILPRLVEVQLFQTILESSASEHSARMLAMKNANEAAGDMIYELTLSYNKARQAAITQEIAEIAGGAAALE